MKNKLKLLPKGWVETTIEDICTSPQYGYTTKAGFVDALYIYRFEIMIFFSVV
jgi:hypothetical protein